MLSTMDNNIQESQNQHTRFTTISTIASINGALENDANPKYDNDTRNIQDNTTLPPISSIDSNNTNPNNNLQSSLPKLSSLKPITQLPSITVHNGTDSAPTKIKEPEQPPSTFKPRIPIEDVLALREFLRQVDLRHYGFHREDRELNVNPPKSFNTAISSSILLNSPRNNSEHQPPRFRSGRMDGDIYSSGHEDDDGYIHGDFDIKSASMIRQHSFMGGVSVVPSSPLKAIRPASPMRTNTSHVPYKGKFGPNPTCASCHTTKTPYWRDAWNQGILLCNACGLRFAKFKRRCTQCHYVPRKEDKGSRFCPMCKGPWTQ